MEAARTFFVDEKPRLFLFTSHDLDFGRKSQHILV